MAKRPFEIGPQVIRVFQADAEAKQPWGDVLFAVPSVAVVDGGLDSAQAGAADDQLQG
jgi:hypothetical protein